MADTPIESKYPWIVFGDERPQLPENPTERDFAKAWATMVMVYQAQRSEISKVMEAHRDERREILDVLKSIKQHQTVPYPMPRWAKLHSIAIAAQTVAIVWLLLSMLGEQKIVAHLVMFHG